MTVTTKLNHRQSHNLAHSPERAMSRAQCADLGLIKVMNILSRGTYVLGGKLGFVGAWCKREHVPLTRENIMSARQVYDSLTTLY